MDHEYAQNENLAERYVLGRLTEEERAGFEDHFMECEACLEAVEAVQDMAPALRAEAARSAAAAVETVARETEARAGLAVLLAAALRRPAGRALAAALLVAVLVPLAYLGLENRRLRGEAGSAGDVAAQLPTALLLPTRGGGDGGGPSVVLEPEQNRFTLLLEVEPDPGIASYEAEIREAGGAPVWRGEGLEAAGGGLLALTFRAERVPPGEYQLRLSARGAGGGREPAGTFPFRVRRGDAPAETAAGVDSGADDG